MRAHPALGVIVVAAILLAAPAAAHVPIGYVKVLRVTQEPYKPVEFRMAIKAPVALTVTVGYKIFDARGRAVYHEMKESFTQPYQHTSLTLRWRKRGYDGLVPPRGRTYYVVPFAGDLEDRDGDDSAGKLVRGRRVAFILR